MKVKHLTAKISTLTMSALLFALLWAWIAASRGRAANPQLGAPSQNTAVAVAAQPAPGTLVRRMVVVRTRNADGTVTERVVPEADYVPAPAPQAAAPASQPVARSRGS